MTWTYNPADFTEQDFTPIPEGNHRVRIEEAIYKTFKSGKDGYEITLSVSGYSGRLWYYLVLDPSDVKKTNQKIGAFFESFGIADHDMNHYRNWAGKVGAVRVKHENYNGEQQAKVAFCLSKRNQDKLSPAKFADAVPSPVPAIEDSELPFM